MVGMSVTVGVWREGFVGSPMDVGGLMVGSLGTREGVGLLGGGGRLDGGWFDSFVTTSEVGRGGVGWRD